MARSELVLNLVKTGIKGDIPRFKKTVEAIAADASAKHHYTFAEQIRSLLAQQTTVEQSSGGYACADISDMASSSAFYELLTQKTLDDLVLPESVERECVEFIEEHHRKDVLRSYGLEPRNKILLAGSPGNGKTSLAEAIANHLMLPFYVVRYEGIFSKYLGETPQKLESLFELVKSRRCVLFFDEFDAIGKEREDPNDNGEAKRIVNSLLKQIDMLPSHVVIVAATNHESMLDRAIWRRFQLQLNIPKPDQKMAERWFTKFESRVEHPLGIPKVKLAKELEGFSFAELEEFALDVRRKFILGLPDSEKKIGSIVSNVLSTWKNKYK